MKIRAFGNTDLLVSEFGLGCARIGGIFQRDSAGFVDLLCGARDAGITFFDTADLYSQGESEALIARAFGKERSRVIIATKAGYTLPAQRKLISRLKPLVRPVIRALKIRRDRLPAAVRGSLSQDFSPAYLRRAVEGSLKRLKTDYIDLFQLHSPPLEIVERGEWHSALQELKRAGKIRYYGISCDSVEVALAALRYQGVSSLQVTLSLLEQRAEQAVLPAARGGGVGVIARECLANGLLVKPRSEIDLKKYTSSPEEELLREEQLTRFRREAEERKTSLASLALEYAGRAEGVSVALLGARSLDQLKRLLAEIPMTLKGPASPSVERGG